jgi:hypothetical protein
MRRTDTRIFASVFVYLTASPAICHEVGQHLGAYQGSDGESRSMARFDGRADAPTMASGALNASFNLGATIEKIRYDDWSNNKYMTSNFPEGQRVDRNFTADSIWTLNKRFEFQAGGSSSGDGVTSTSSRWGGVGQWFLGDQLRVGVKAQLSETDRPADSKLDYDSKTIYLSDRVTSQTGSVALKAILNPLTIVTSDYALTQSSERPPLRSYGAGIKQFVPMCECSFHADAARVINLGKLDTTMSTGELTGTQVTLAYLQTLTTRTHGRLSYRYAREDEYTRAYGDHLVFGADSYTFAIAHEEPKIRINGAERPLTMDLAATRYIHNQGGAATTFEAGAGVKF